MAPPAQRIRPSRRSQLRPPSHAPTGFVLQMIQKNSGDIPEGVRRQDLDQIYKRIKAGMDKQARMAFLQLDDVVRNAERVKNMAEDDGL